MTLPAKSGLLPLQTAIFTRLDADLTTPVHSEVPDNTTYPYVVIGTETGGDYSTRDKYGVEIEVEIEVYSKDRGTDEIKGIVDAVMLSFSTPAFDLSSDGFVVNTINLESVSTDETGDGKTRRAELIYNFRLMEA